jgi:hypothetical protein
MKRSDVVRSLLDMYKHSDPALKVTWEYDRPYTDCYMTFTDPHRDEIYSVRGRAKVSWPDEWSPDRGAAMTLKRAARKLADLLIAQEEAAKIPV